VAKRDRLPESSRLALKFNIALLLALFVAALCHAQDLPIGVTYICSGAHIYIEGCSIRDTSHTSTCMVAHPDHLTPSGLNTYTSVTRGALKKLLPTQVRPILRLPQRLFSCDTNAHARSERVNLCGAWLFSPDIDTADSWL
jgi:hypothetical protein